MKKLIFSSKYFMFLFMLSSLVYIGCHKDDGKELASVSSESTQFRTTVTPTVENGTLKFNSNDDVIEYLKGISIISEDDQTLIIDIPGFTSLHKKNKESEELTGKDESYFIDDRLNAILNENYEFMIGDRVYVKKNLDETWSVNKTDLVGLNKLRQKLPGDKFSPADDSESFLMEDGDKIEVFSKASCKAKIRIIDKRVPHPSEPIFSTEDGISTYCVEVFGIQGGTLESLTVDWGDGTTPTTTSSTIFNQCHTYTNRGDFRIKVSLKMSCSNTPFVSSRLVSPFTKCCKLKSKETKNIIIGDLKMDAEYQRVIFLERFYWKAKTTSRAAGSNNRVLAKNTAQITALFRTHDFCNEISHEGDSDTCNSCKDVAVDLWHNENDNIINKHADVVITCTMLRHGVTLTHTFVPNCE